MNSKIIINDANKKLFLKYMHTIPKFIICDYSNKDLYKKYKHLIECQNETKEPLTKTYIAFHTERINQWSEPLPIIVNRINELKTI